METKWLGEILNKLQQQRNIDRLKKMRAHHIEYSTILSMVFNKNQTVNETLLWKYNDEWDNS